MTVWSAGKQMQLHSESQLVLHKCLKNVNTFQFKKVCDIRCNEDFRAESDFEESLAEKIIRFLFVFSHTISSKQIRVAVLSSIAPREERTMCIDWRVYSSILYHLIFNAVKFNKPEGVIIIRLKLQSNFNSHLLG